MCELMWNIVDPSKSKGFISNQEYYYYYFYYVDKDLKRKWREKKSKVTIEAFNLKTNTQFSSTNLSAKYNIKP